MLSRLMAGEHKPSANTKADGSTTDSVDSGIDRKSSFTMPDGSNSSLKRTVTTQTDDIKESNAIPDILEKKGIDSQMDLLYVVEVHAKSGGTRTFYSEQQFPGWDDPISADEKTQIAPFELHRSIVASLKQGRQWKPAMEKRDFADQSKIISLTEDLEVESAHTPSLWIYSSMVKMALQHIVKYDPEHVLRGEHRILIKWPYKLLLQHYHLIESFTHDISLGKRPMPSALDEFDSLEVSKALDKLLNLIGPEYRNIYLPEIERHEKDKGVTFENIWTLFTPGELVFSTMDGEPSAFIVSEAILDSESAIFKDRPDLVRDQYWLIYIWNYRFVDGLLRRHASEVKITRFDGTRLITNLDVYPAKYLDEDRRNSILDKLEEQGKKFLRIASTIPCHMAYRGTTLGINGITGAMSSKPRLVSDNIH